MRKLSRWVTAFEEGAIAALLGAMTLIAFSNVVARYVFNSNILWALEATVFLFAWLTLFGASYCVKITAHLGVDAIAAAVPARVRKAMTLVAVGACIVFAAIMLVAGWDYWFKFATTASFLETQDIPMPAFLAWLAEYTNEGEPYEKIPRFIPYAILPISMALLLFRFVEAGWRVLTDQQSLIIVSHELDDPNAKKD